MGSHSRFLTTNTHGFKGHLYRWDGTTYIEEICVITVEGRRELHRNIFISHWNCYYKYIESNKIFDKSSRVTTKKIFLKYSENVKGIIMLYYWKIECPYIQKNELCPYITQILVKIGSKT